MTNGRTSGLKTLSGACRSRGLGLVGLFVVLFLSLSSTAWAAAMVTNGGFDGSTSWTLGTSTYSTTYNHNTIAPGAGSVETATPLGKNKTATGTATQSVTITAGGVISAKADVVVWAGNIYSGAAGATNTVTIDLRYSDATTVNIFTGTVTPNTVFSWANITNNTATVFPLTLTKAVNQITVTVTTSTGNNTSATSSLYVDDIAITFTPATIDSLTVTSNTPVATTAIPGVANIQMQRLQLNSDATGNGNCVLTSATVEDVNIATTGTISNLKVHIDDDTNFTNGSLGTATVATWNGESTVVDLTGIAAANRTITNGTPKYLWVTYDIDAAALNGTTAISRITALGVATPDNAPLGGPWESNSILITAGLGCGGCHPLPVLDGVSRDGATGAVQGNHTTHGTTFAYQCNTCHIEGSQVTGGTYTSRHRRGTIEMNASGIGAVANARYDKNADHVADTTWNQSPTPTLGKCENTACHGGVNSATSYGGPTGAGPSWGGAAVADKCTFCHNSNKTNSGGVANAYPTTASPFRSANAASAHALHLTGTSGLFSGGVQCADCHTVPGTTGAAGHIDTNITAPADITFGSAAQLNSTAVSYVSGTLTCTVYCHGANMPRGDTSGTSEVPAWTANWTNYPTGCTNACHGLPPTSGSSASTHSGQAFPTSCKNCHGDTVTSTTNPPTMVASKHINGIVESSGCNGCHGNSATNQIWPMNSGADDGATTPNIIGAHQLHMQWLAKQVYNENLATLITDNANGSASAKQQTLCQYCHAIGDSDHMGTTVADVFKTTTLTAAAPKMFWNGAAETGTLGTFETTGNTCSNVDCHAQYGTAAAGSEPIATPDWYITPTHSVATSALPTTMNCSACHNNPSSDTTSKHTNHLNATATFGLTITCARCHDAATVWGSPTGTLPASGHLNGTFATSGSVTQTYAGSFRTSFGGCGTNACHNNGVNGAPAAYTWGTAITNCTECHGNATTLTTNAHNEHLNNGYTGAACTDCHTLATAATHINATVNIDATKATYNGTVVVGDVGYGTCLTASCHNLNTKTDQSAAWNIPAGTGTPGTNDLACDDCHYYAASPTAAGNTAHARPLSTTHGDHFTAGKVCTQCHGALPTTTTHIGNKTSLADGAVALQDESTLVWTDATAVTDYTFDDTGNTCYTPTNNGLGCHATAGLAGAADPTRPDWDVAFDGTNGVTGCVACHTDTTTTAVNPTSGLHGVVPSVTGQQHNQSVNATTGCKACHNTMPVAGNHKNGTLTGDTISDLGLQFYTQTAANTGTCSSTGTGCHMTGGTNLNYRDDWAHKWVSTANYYTTNTTSCGGCHGDWNQGWNGGVVHRTTSGTQSNHGEGTTWQCGECHVLENGAAYVFTFSTNDWAEKTGETTSKHGNATIEINSTGNTYNTTSNLCTGCHSTSDNVHNFVDTTWTIATLAGTNAPTGAGHAPGANCIGCHAAVNGTRRAIQGEFPATLQHGAAWASMTSADCEKCHNEASGPNSIVELKVWNADNSTFTSANYDKANLSTANTHCLSCHDATRGVTIAGLSPPARSMANYTSTTTYNNHNFTTATGAVVPQRAKAISPHGNPSGNKLKAAADTAVTVAIGCLHCHPSHGSTYGSKTATADATGSTTALATSRMLGGNPSALSGVGYDYTSEGALVDPALCWGCHDATGVADYYGDTTTGHWNGGVWKSPTFSYKTGKGGVATLHIANKQDGGTADNAAANIVCTTCHDVHGSPTVAQFYSPALKGKWLTSPYYEDRAPPSKTAGTNGLYSWPNANSAARSTADALSPRAAVATGTLWAPKEIGGGYGVVGTQNGAWGWFIDGNTFGMSAYQPYKTGAVTQKYFYNIDATNFTSTGLTNYAGLCMTYCHSAANIETRLTWTGHNPVVPGFGGGDAATDLINVNGTTKPSTVAKVRNQMVGQGWYNNADYGQNLFANDTPGERQGGDAGAIDGKTYSHNAAFSYGVNPAATGAQAGYHQFPCSKCHNPHASVLPALMRTNCLNTAKSGYEWRMAAEANNCHRVEDSGAPIIGPGDPYPGTGYPATHGGATLGGWNAVTPW